MFNHILLAADGTEPSVHAAGLAGEIARSMKSATLCIMVPYTPVPAFLGDPQFDKVTAARLIEADGIVNTMKKAIGEIPGELSVEVLEGPAAQAILHVSEVHHSDLIVMGSRGLGTLGHLMVGKYLCPVMIVH
jgi:nucleotide-binding universal stress UspA family protein